MQHILSYWTFNHVSCKFYLIIKNIVVASGRPIHYIIPIQVTKCLFQARKKRNKEITSDSYVATSDVTQLKSISITVGQGC